MSKQTAVEWLVAHFKEYGFDFSHHEREINQAKAMEKEQMESIYGKEIIVKEGSHHLIQPFEDYYTKTYGGDK
jgi:secreted Zn-dependent insulinase-like peptidase